LLTKKFDYRPSSQYISVKVMQVFRLCKYVFAPRKSPVEMQSEILDFFFFLRKFYVVRVYFYTS
jgi:hypothetical protein